LLAPVPSLTAPPKEMNRVLLASTAAAVGLYFASTAAAVGTPDSLWIRMGEEAVIRPMCNDIYDRHASDPITKDWFPPHSAWNQRTAEQVKENVFTFFSAGIGGPHEYKGSDMVKAHAKMGVSKPITESAFTALCYHVLEQMHAHGSGGETEVAQVYDILMSLKGDVVSGGMAAHEKTQATLYDRMGGEDVLKPMCNDLYDLHASDPLTAPWFGPDKPWNQRGSHADVKETVWKFVCAGFGGPCEYPGRSMIETHTKMGVMKPITKPAFHAVVYHAMTVMKKHGAGEREMDELYGVLQSLKSQVVRGVENESEL